MSDLKNLLDREASRISAKPDALEGVHRRARRRHRSRQIVAGVTALALVGAVAVGAWTLLGERPDASRPGDQGQSWPAGAWPHETRGQAEEAQASVDRGDPKAQWQTSAGETAWRYLRSQHGWAAAHYAEDFKRDGADEMTFYASSCDLDHEDSCEGQGVASGPDQEVILTIERLVRPGEGGVWTVTKVIGPSTAMVGSMFGYGRVIIAPGAVDEGGGFTCPEGPFATPTDAAARTAAERFLEASNSPAPDPAAIWDMLEPSVRRFLGPYEIFAYRLTGLPAEPYDAWTVDYGDTDVENAADLEAACPGIGPHLAEAGVTFPDDPQQGIPVQLVFVAYEEGLRLWSVRG